MPRVNSLVMDALLNAVDDDAVEIYVCENQPTTRAEAIANSLMQTPAFITRFPGKTISGAAGLDQDGGNRQYTDGPYNTVILNNITGLQAPNFFALCSASVLLQVADVAGAIAVSDGTTVDFDAFNYIINAPV